MHPELKGAVGPAHPILDPDTNDYYSFNVDFGLGSQAIYRLFCISASTGNTTILSTIQAPAAYIHSFFLTENYVILCIPVSHLDAINMIREGSVMGAMKPFNHNETCRWFVVDRRGKRGLVAQFCSPASFFLHSTNAFEAQNGDIICEFIEYPDTSVISMLYYDVMLGRDEGAREFWADAELTRKFHPHLVRWRLRKALFKIPSTKHGSVPAAYQDLDIPGPHAGDLPTINPSYACRENRYVYCLVSRGFSTMFDSIAKTDVKTREVLNWSGGHGQSPGEAIFIPRPNTNENGQELDEDDGVLLSVVLDGPKRTSYLVCLDARSMVELGRAECDFAIGFGFHGQHIKAA